MTRTSKLATAARIVLGLVFALSGLNHLFEVIPMPPMTGATALFWQGLAGTGYFFSLLGAVEVIAALLLLRGRWVPLALAMLAPVVINATAFHLGLAPQGLPVMALLITASLILAWRHREAFAPVLRARTAPVSTAVRAVEVGLGLVFVASGVMGLLGRTPPASTAGAALMLEGLAAAGYFLPLLGAVQIAAGLALVARRFVGLALLALAPLVLQIAAYRLYVATPGMLVAALAITAGQVGLLFVHRDLFASFLAGPPASPRLAVAGQAAVAG